jgi:predicted DNA-binding transcriptional regulator YafY
MTVTDAIALAAKNLRTVIISYVKRDGTVTTTEVEPYSYRVSKNGVTRLMGFDVAKQDWRSFIVSNIASATISDKKFIPKYTVEIN